MSNGFNASVLLARADKLVLRSISTSEEDAA